MNSNPLIILFGSQARGAAGSKSDYDIAVLADHFLSLEEKEKIRIRIAKKININEDSVDLVDLWGASPLIQMQAADTGQLLEGDAFAFLRFRVLAWKRYQDTAKFRKARELALTKKYGS